MLNLMPNISVSLTEILGIKFNIFSRPVSLSIDFIINKYDERKYRGNDHRTFLGYPLTARIVYVKYNLIKITISLFTFIKARSP